MLANGNAAAVLERLQALSPEALTTEALTLEEIFVATLQPDAPEGPRGSGRVTVARCFPIRFWKEIRGLSPAWLACLAAMAVAAGLGGRVRSLGLFAYFLGAVALGALSLGHEYNCRTLTLLLSQPASRQRLLLEKMGVLAVMLLALCGVAWLGAVRPGCSMGLGARSARNCWAVALGLPLLCGLFVAPWLTMACRNALAGRGVRVGDPGDGVDGERSSRLR